MNVRVQGKDELGCPKGHGWDKIGDLEVRPENTYGRIRSCRFLCVELRRQRNLDRGNRKKLSG